MASLRTTITGPSGFIGSNLLSHFADCGAQVSCYNLRYPQRFGSAGPSGDVLIHCAGIAHTEFPDPDLIHQANHELPLQTAEWAKAKGYAHFVFLSTSLVWDESLEVIDTGRDTPTPNTHYGKAKLAAEQDILDLTSRSFAVSVVRLPLVYGPGVKGNLARLIDAVTNWTVCPLGSREAIRSVTGVSTIGLFIQHLVDYRLTGVFTLVDTPKISTFEMVCLLRNGLPSSGITVPLPRFTRLALDRVSPSISRRLLHSRVIMDNTVRETGFNPIVEREVVRDGFTQMARRHYEYAQRKQES